ncbi:MAG: DNA-formamidopyrimidine glycosylase [Anaerolineaceae bacterium]|nr:DNA-formamidopyrimidine glycosylase [Anaerolineaceae bacterium]
MPELPEVETIARALRSGGRGGVSILGRKVQRAELLWPGCLQGVEAGEFVAQTAGFEILAVSRRGKYLCFSVGERFLLVHLRMSGDLRVETQLDEQGAARQWLPHDRLALLFEDGHRMVFNDARKFGRVWLVNDPQEVTRDLGPEPFQEHFSADAFYKRLQTFRRQIKPLLLDQHFIAGLGNIYTDEALFQARIHPLTPSDRITPAQAASLWTAIRNVLSEGIHRNGASIDWVYRGGDFQNNFEVYQRTGEPCSVCGTPIEKTFVGQRGTHFCPSCQRAPGDVTNL